ncbi:PAS domain S-box-containing protein/diguanylate cyclase (GGDEF) domain-containing protein [Alteromonadaceae bacterium Bs31]|nr:PAS domain S-box-containing protein/diguanylate cyclase (GGDEF) domain-containing protein [Alteromonadaceae bacterium Bs31]
MDVDFPAQTGYKATLADICAAFLVIISLAVLLGWVFQFRLLTTFSTFTTYPSMQANTAVGIMMLGMGLFALTRKQPPLLIFSTITCLLFACATLIQYASNTDLGIDDLFLKDNWSQHNPGRMAPITAINLAFCAGLLLSHRYLAKKIPLLLDVLLLLFFMEVLLALNVYLIDARALLGSYYFSGYSLPTNLCFVLFIVGLVSASETGMHSLFTTNSSFRMHALSLIGLVLLFSIVVSALGTTQSPQTIFTNAVFSSLACCLAIYLMGNMSQKNILADKDAAKTETGEQAIKHDFQRAVLRILNSSEDAMLLADERRRILCANKGATRIFGWSLDELKNMKLETLVPKRYQSVDIGIFHQFTLSNEAGLRFGERAKSLGLTKRGVERPISITLYKCEKISESGDIESLQENNDTSNEARIDSGVPPLEDGSKIYTLIFIRELSGLETAMAELNQNSTIDRLTGLSSHEEFVRYCTDVENQSTRRDDKFISIMFIDLDSFKVINEKFGRDFGDHVLLNVATTLKSKLRSSDKLFRYGADEFLLISESHSEEQADLMAERIRTSVKVSPTKLSDTNVYITCSIALSCTQSVRVGLQEKTEQLRTEIHSRSNTHKDCVINVKW